MLRKNGLLLKASLFACFVTLFASPSQAATLDEMAGQMILVGFSGSTVDSQSVSGVRDLIADGRVGGVMYLKNNVSDLQTVRAMNAAFMAASNGLPPFIALDQEGGQVERLTRSVGFKEVQSAADIASGMSAEAAGRVYGEMANSLAALGFNLNFGPVADVNFNPSNPVIARFGRSYSADPATVARFAAAFIDAHRGAQVLTALKHFPGHGSSDKDSHEGFVDVTQSWQAAELEPYRQLIGSGHADMVMVAHIYHAAFVDGDAAQPPSSLSPNWISGVLRYQLGYEGVVISDDLEMGAIRSHFSFRDTIVRAVRAGTDILLYSNTANYRLSLADEVRQVLVEEALADPDFKARIEESYQRIVALKQRIAG